MQVHAPPSRNPPTSCTLPDGVSGVYVVRTLWSPPDQPLTRGPAMSVAEASTSPSLKQLALGDLNHELNTTRKLLERVPEAHLDWKPHEKSMTLGGLALHVATSPSWLIRVLSADHFDIAPVGRNPPPTSLQEILDAFEERVATMRQALDAADDAALTQPWQLRRGEQVLQTMPRVAVIRA